MRLTFKPKSKDGSWSISAVNDSISYFKHKYGTIHHIMLPQALKGQAGQIKAAHKCRVEVSELHRADSNYILINNEQGM